MIRKWPALPALLYILGSILLGPAIFLAGYLITPANGDFCDMGPHGTREQRDRDYALIDTIQTAGAAIMLVVGAVILVHLWLNARRIGGPAAALLSIGVLFMGSGYCLLLSVALYGNPSC